MSIRISVAIMHHPSRSHRLPRLVRACAPLRPRVVSDPDPTGPPSPLRTAKRAWAAVPDDATHHLVLQDDAAPTAGFAGYLADALARRPRHAVALYSNWNSPQNSYLVRRAAAAGSPWAPLAPAEWVPTQGLVLPAAQARELAAFLAPIPDAIRDDDEMVALFCQERGIPVVATVPHLVDHADELTIAGHPGSFHATVWAGGRHLPPEHWSPAEEIEAELTRRAAAREPRDFVVELIDSRCVLRFLRPGSGEPIEHPFGWYWREWSILAGIDAGEIEDAFAEAGTPAPLVPSTSAEVWAAGYILGADVSRLGRRAWDPFSAELLRDAIGSWIDCGLSTADRLLLDAASRSALVDLGVAAVERGLAATLPERIYA
ncbi:hypothetical protein SAMN05216276_1012170 [Streptosporangium subroseum]|uniref:Uncharacterized protein n=1 Tax=Streptosporangium subroseum TaxID=106412 RepID=A0A239G064_9ACTN|nr:hypothetical protein [Streptosporangium subroseum]SNS62430.1 hypothetical protein SAMN05216276_1012170 [Streptosporangium subroseum]